MCVEKEQRRAIDNGKGLDRGIWTIVWEIKKGRKSRRESKEKQRGDVERAQGINGRDTI